MTKITSTQNPKIKELLRLEKANVRKEKGLFVIEGYREIKKAAEIGFIFQSLYICPELLNSDTADLAGSLREAEKFEVAENVFSRIAYRDNREGILVTAHPKYPSLHELRTGPSALYLVLETVEKPGNLGAILRTADAAGIDAVIVCDNQTDLYNPNVIRASLGCLFTNTVIITTSESAIDFFQKNGIRIYAAALQDSTEYYDADFRQASAIVLGSEAEGLSNLWRVNADRKIRIPMHGAADSLNVSVSAAILIFEAIRQRKADWENR